MLKSAVQHQNIKKDIKKTFDLADDVISCHIPCLLSGENYVQYLSMVCVEDIENQNQQVFPYGAPIKIRLLYKRPKARESVLIGVLPSLAGEERGGRWGGGGGGCFFLAGKLILECQTP